MVCVLVRLVASGHRIRPFNNDGNALPNADAHGAQSVTSFLAGRVAALKFVQGRGYEPGATHPQWVAKGNGATVGVDVLGVVRKPNG